MRDRRRRGVFVVVLSVVLLVALATAAAAAVELAKPNSWDDVKLRYENGEVTMWLNHDLQPFWSQITFDTEALIDVPGCGTSEQTVYAGPIDVGLGFRDTIVDHKGDANGFQGTGGWALVDCSAFATEKYPPASAIIAECVAANPNAVKPCEIEFQDKPMDCSTSTCAQEIVTRLHLVTDLDCDGTIDAKYAPEGGLCLYWAATKPPFESPFWQGTLQTRVTYPGGRKTLNFREFGPNAISVGSFSGTSSAVPWAVVLGLGAVVTAGAGIVSRRARGRSDRRKEPMTEMQQTPEPGTYEPPAVVYESDLEVRAGSPLLKLPEGLDLPE